MALTVFGLQAWLDPGAPPALPLSITQSLPSDGTVKIETGEVKLIKNWYFPFMDLNTEKCFFNNCVDSLPPS